MYNNNILVVGGAGYIGSHVVFELCNNGYNVTVFDNFSTGFNENIDTRANVIRGDILNEYDLSNLFKKKYNAVFHFAGLKSSGDSMLNPVEFTNINISGSINLLRHIIKNKIDIIIFSSTAAIYGSPEYLPIDEKHPQNPINFYGFTKKKIEELIKWNNDSFNIYFTEVYPNLRGIGIKSLPVFLLKELYNIILNVEFSDHMLLNMIQKAIDDNQEDKQKMIKEIKLFDSSRNQNFRDYLHPNLISWLDG